MKKGALVTHAGSDRGLSYTIFGLGAKPHGLLGRALKSMSER
jgi:hypothetical protein